MQLTAFNAAAPLREVEMTEKALNTARLRDLRE
jgi:hypothetical protein